MKMRVISCISVSVIVLVQLGCLRCDDLTITPVTGPLIHGEGPYWDAKEKALYLVDISGEHIYRYDEASGQVTNFLMDGPVAFVIDVYQKDGCLLVGRGRDLVYVNWDGATNGTLAKITSQRNADRIGCTRGAGEGVVLASVGQSEEKKGNRYNDAKADIIGRLWAGTMGYEANGVVDPKVGTLYSLETNEDVPSPKVTDVDISNGITWNADNTVMYYIDSPTRRIDAFDYDVVTGKIEKRRTVFRLDQHNLTGVPDGMTIDRNGNLWVALYNGKAVIKVNPSTSELVQRIEMPCDYVTSATFGGSALDTLYVTTSRRDVTPQQLAGQPTAGAVFAIRGHGEVGMNNVNEGDFKVKRDNLKKK